MSQIRGLTIQLPIVGTLVSHDAPQGGFTVETRSGTRFEVYTKPTTWIDTMTNLDRLGRRRSRVDKGKDSDHVKDRPEFLKDSDIGDMIAIEGTLYLDGEFQRYEAMTIHLLKSHRGYYLFEHTHWWKAQIESMANKWLDVLFGDKRTYSLDDFSALYRTTLNIEGLPTDDDTQEMATLSRLIYGLSSAYLLGGDERYYLAAEAGVKYQREAFRSYSTDGEFCFWLHARKRDRHGVYDLFASTNAEDAGTVPLYEQIYALAGLAQFYRITNDRETLEDIKHTLKTFTQLFADKSSDAGGGEGFFSHIDPVTFRWDSPELEQVGPGNVNHRARKNWNSIGDHLPAYLINLILSLDPLPKVADDSDGEHVGMLNSVLRESVKILEDTSRLINQHFPEKDNPYVNERFTRDWQPVQDWHWQQNRAVVGHNLKIAWNLTRVANYYQSKGKMDTAAELFERSNTIGKEMATKGIDGIRSGVFDAVERVPADKMPVQFAWQNTKDFWQQEQGILAYLIMSGYIRDPQDPQAATFLGLARELSAFWNLYFLDRERNGIFFRVSDNGIPVISSTYGDKGGHSISGYHAFELSYLAHIYQLAYLPRKHRTHTTFCLHFRPSRTSGLSSINVLPDFLGPDTIAIAGVEVDGVPRRLKFGRDDFQVPLQPDDLGRSIKVYLWQSDAAYSRLSKQAISDDHLPDSERGISVSSKGVQP